MDIVTFRTFLAAAESGSFARAAQRVNASPSTVTERIQQLESRLSARLFERDKRGCRLSPAGERFMLPARQAVRAWEVARHEVSLPDRFERSISFGGQYSIWPSLLPWLSKVRSDLLDLSVRATSGASRRLNRDLSEGLLDLVVLYDPVFRSDVVSQPVCDDQLVLVTGSDPAAWRENYVPIEWGQTIGPRIASQIGIAPENGLLLDLGERSAEWLVNEAMSGYLPKRIAATYLAEGSLVEVGDAPTFDYPIFACWRRDLDEELAGQLVDMLKDAFRLS
ncbi:LysR family transcriptional regulator [Erythrobacter sp. HA6-11]